MLTHRVGSALDFKEPGPNFIAHVCNDAGKWGSGFVLAVSERYPFAEKMFRKHGPMTLGSLQLCLCDFERDERGYPIPETEVWVANMVGQHDIYHEGGMPPVRYEAIRSALKKVHMYANIYKANVHMPKIGAGLAGGDWSVIEPIIVEELHDVPTFVYTFVNKDAKSFVPEGTKRERPK